MLDGLYDEQIELYYRQRVEQVGVGISFEHLA